MSPPPSISQVWKIEDFLVKWGKATEVPKTGEGGKAVTDDPVALILLKEIDNYKRCLPHLKGAMRGSGWEDNHWLQVQDRGGGRGGRGGCWCGAVTVCMVVAVAWNGSRINAGRQELAP